MARTTQITREALVDAGVRLVLEKGLEALNARSLAAQAGCSIQPVFRNFGSMENLRETAAMKGLPSDNLEETFLALVDEDNRKRRPM